MGRRHVVYVIVVALVVGFAGCKKESMPPKTGNAVNGAPIPAARNMVMPAANSAMGNTMDWMKDRDKYAKDQLDKVAEYQKKWAELSQKAAMNEENKDLLPQFATDLKNQMANATAKINDARNATQADWPQRKAALDEAINTMKATYDTASSKLKT